jgi:hypothetical protein
MYYIYNIYKASLKPGSVQQIMPYHWQFKLFPLYSRDMDHAGQKTQLPNRWRGMLPSSCLANSLGADHIENIFHSFNVFL